MSSGGGSSSSIVAAATAVVVVAVESKRKSHLVLGQTSHPDIDGMMMHYLLLYDLHKFPLGIYYSYPY